MRIFRSYMIAGISSILEHYLSVPIVSDDSHRLVEWPINFLHSSRLIQREKHKKVQL